jgi:hypothetical protein
MEVLKRISIGLGVVNRCWFATGVSGTCLPAEGQVGVARFECLVKATLDFRIHLFLVY